MLKKFRYTWFFLIIILVFGGCATYYQRTQKFQEELHKGNFDKAYQWLNNNDKDATGKNAVLYHLNKGYVTFMQNQYQESNKSFHQADILIEDYYKSLGKEAVALLTNPMMKPYKPEDFEAVLLHFFTSLNYINLNQYDEALVECKRINIKLNALNDRYKDHKNRYQQDAFGHVLMGLIYEHNKDYNNAFIAYRNALNIYKEDYKKYFNVDVPQQLKKDILRTAYKTGFNDELRQFEKEFNMKYEALKEPEASLVFFWMTGWGPVKDEWSIMFTKSNYQNGYLTLVNPEYGLNFKFYVGDRSTQEKKGFNDLSVLRVAFPKYQERPPYYQQATLSHENKKYPLDMAENINNIAFKTLKDRMIREMGNSLLRLATKKALEKAVNNQDANLGTAVSIANALTEKADTRNWQSLPYAIHYKRIPLHQGENKVKLEVKASSKGPVKEHDFTFNAQPNRLYFHSFHSIETKPIQP